MGGTATAGGNKYASYDLVVTCNSRKGMRLGSLNCYPGFASYSHWWKSQTLNRINCYKFGRAIGYASEREDLRCISIDSIIDDYRYTRANENALH